MHWFSEEFIRFLYMGGYAQYVWPAYGFAFVLLFLTIYIPWRQRKKLLKKLKA